MSWVTSRAGGPGCRRALAGVGWAMFGTVATTMVDPRAAQHRGRTEERRRNSAKADSEDSNACRTQEGK